jgi:hypothetical protein
MDTVMDVLELRHECPGIQMMIFLNILIEMLVK